MGVTIAFLQSGLGHHLMSGIALSAEANVNSSYLLYVGSSTTCRTCASNVSELKEVLRHEQTAYLGRRHKFFTVWVRALHILCLSLADLDAHELTQTLHGKFSFTLIWKNRRVVYFEAKTVVAFVQCVHLFDGVICAADRLPRHVVIRLFFSPFHTELG